MSLNPRQVSNSNFIFRCGIDSLRIFPVAHFVGGNKAKNLVFDIQIGFLEENYSMRKYLKGDGFLKEWKG